VARFGGDEFAILLERSADPWTDAEAVAGAVLGRLRTALDVEGATVHVSASIGVSVGRAGSRAADLLRDADIAMYRAKCTGKARMVAYESGMRSEAMMRLQIETDLGRAVEREQLRLVFQPVIGVDDGDIAGFEALLRWDHPTLGELLPDRFIELAETTGDIIDIGRWVLRTACATGARWQRLVDAGGGPRLEMAVNVSARQLADEHFVVDVAEALSFAGLPPGSLLLEMTETALIEDAAVAAHRLAELRNLGVRLAVDDFGTGYSSLSYLRQFPVDVLKIDRSFISTIGANGDVPPIVLGLLELSRTLGLRTVAEGVEERAQLDGLRAAKCAMAQGFLFARPLAAIDAEALLAGRRMAADDPRP
jgi:predicted signal transduction protein with EAL and GGDEF domain